MLILRIQNVAFGSRASLWCKFLSSYAPQVFDEFTHRGMLHQPSNLISQSQNLGSEIGSNRTIEHTDAHEALVSFCQSNRCGMKPTQFLLCSAITLCAKTDNLFMGLQIHASVVKIGHADNLFINSALVDLYAKCSAIEDARKVFARMPSHDQVSWTSIITGFSQNGRATEAILLFKEMLRSETKPNSFTYSSAVSACRGLQMEMLEAITLLHAHIVRLGFDTNSFVLSSLIDCYSKCGRIDCASLLFNEIKGRDVILFNSTISGYAQNSFYIEALNLFIELMNCSLSPTNHTLSTILSCCGGLTCLQQGKQVHSLATKIGSESNVFVASSLIDMYAKCGSIDEAAQVFDQAGTKNSVLWTSMITGYAQSGQGPKALKLFERFMFEGYKPDHVSFTAVLTACNHAGLFDEGVNYFNKMTKVYGLVPELDQYACLVDLYGRFGQLRKARDLMEEMPYAPNNAMWTSLLGYCKVYGDVELGTEAAQRVFELEPKNAAAYVTLSSIYAKAGLWKEMNQVRKLMQQRRVKKSVGWSYIEVGKSVNVFSVGNASHPLSEEIYAELDKLRLDMIDSGYVYGHEFFSDDLIMED